MTHFSYSSDKSQCPIAVVYLLSSLRALPAFKEIYEITNRYYHLHVINKYMRYSDTVSIWPKKSTVYFSILKIVLYIEKKGSHLGIPYILIFYTVLQDCACCTWQTLDNMSCRDCNGWDL